MTSHPPEGEFRATLRWQDGFIFSLTMPAALIATLGYSIGALGAWSAALLWGASMLIALATNWVYSELAGMFPTKSGGIALYANEGWRRRFTLAGPIATFGYWFAWTGSIAVYGEIIGSLVETRWLSDRGFSVDAGFFTFGLSDVIAAAAVIAVFVVNLLGIRPTVRLAYLTAAMLMIPLAVLLVGPFLTGDWSASKLSWHLGDAGQAWGGWKLAIVWLYVMLWTSLGVETCATFAPEYRRPARDASMALRVAALFSLVVFVLLPISITGLTGEQPAIDDPVGFYVTAFDLIGGGITDLMVAFVVGSLMLVMLTSMADGSRALYGIAAERLTLRQLKHLNRFGVPSRCLAIDLVTNLCLIFLLGSLLAILAAGNLGYLLAHIFTLVGFVLLRRDRPDLYRPVRVHRVFVPITLVLAAMLGLELVVGAGAFEITGYGGTREILIAVGILASSVVLYAVRRVVQDREPFRLREGVIRGGE